MNSFFSRKTILLGVFCFFIGLVGWFANYRPVVYAQTANTASASARVTAFVEDNTPPSTPILISPENNSIINTNTPAFVWRGSEDDFVMGSYTLFLDGNVLFDNLPLTDVETSDYILEYNATTHQYSLTPKESLNDGTHTWKIKAIDINSNERDSATWSFTIDTLAPNFIVVEIGDQTTSISNQDPSTIPVEPLILENNSPIIKATGEPLSYVAMTLTIPGDPVQIFTEYIDENGDWSIQLGVLPRGIIMTLDFVITDQVGHTSFLQNIQFIIKDTPPEPVDEIKETIHEIIQEVIEIIPPSIIKDVTNNLIQKTTKVTQHPATQSVSALTQSPYNTITSKIKSRYGFPFSFINLIIAMTIPTITIVLVASGFWQDLSPSFIKKIFYTLGFLPNPIQGMVYDAQGIAFAKIIAVREDKDSLYSYRDIAITDHLGFFRGLKMPTGHYRIVVQHSAYSFPAAQNKPLQLSDTEFYQGEPFELTETSRLPLLLIPADFAKEEYRYSILMHLKRWFAQLNTHPLKVIFPLWIITILVTIMYSSIINWLVVVGYFSLITWRLKQKFDKINLVGLIADTNKEFLSNVIVRTFPLKMGDYFSENVNTDNNISNEPSYLERKENPFYGNITTTDKNGEYSFQNKLGVYALSLIKRGFTWLNRDLVINSVLVNIDKDSKNKPREMVSVLSELGGGEGGENGELSEPVKAIVEEKSVICVLLQGK